MCPPPYILYISPVPPYNGHFLLSSRWPLWRGSTVMRSWNSKTHRVIYTRKNTGADPEFFLGGGALVSCSTSTPINHIVFFLENTSCIRKPQVISGGGGRCAPPAPSPRSAPYIRRVLTKTRTFRINGTFRLK